MPRIPCWTMNSSVVETFHCRRRTSSSVFSSRGRWEARAKRRVTVLGKMAARPSMTPPASKTTMGPSCWPKPEKTRNLEWSISGWRESWRWWETLPWDLPS
jgi:hypothetical protein